MKDKSRQLLVTGTLFFLAAIIVTLLIPVEGHYMERYNVGEVWQGENLNAPFDFPIAKSETEILNDRRNVERTSIPVYSYDSSAFNFARQSLVVTIDDPVISNRAVRIAEFIYSKGIMPNLDVVSAPDDAGLTYIRTDKNSLLETVSTGEVFTVASAKRYFREQFYQYFPEDSTVFNSDSFILPNLIYNESLTEALKQRELRNVATTKGIVHANELIVAHNQVIDQEIYNKLSSLKAEYEKRLGGTDNFYMMFTGHFIVVLLIFFITFLFFYYFKNTFINKRKNALFILMLFILMVGLCSIVTKNEHLSVYIIPFAIVPVYIMTFFDYRMSVYEYTTILLLCSLIVPKPVEFFFINFIAGIVAMFIINRSYRRERIFMAAGAILLSNCVSYISINLIQYGEINSINWINFVWFGVNAILFLGMYQLIYLMEKIFGFVSDVTLLELCDTNQKLLLELAHKAPGTFQHTLQVANLSEAAATAIEANPLLARTGAMYHDIGKINNPAFFIENNRGAFNPHDELKPRESAKIILRHVTDGVALAKKERLPQVITDFISGHHGDSLVYYFYCKERTETGREPDKKDFRYHGPKPVSKEVSICMITDAVEAASHSLTEYTNESIDALVDRVVEMKINEKELSASLLSFNDISKIKNVLKEKLYSIYHTRVAYPDRE
ncbi:MAG: HDIG domain-containing protein [Rikenellaceae bacterium]|nr:HDIG domain-containing protein [Rikenellaceae bacterium]